MLQSQNKKSYVTLDYDNLTEKGLKKLLDELKLSGLEVDKITPATSPRKIDGIYTKTFSIISSDGQEMVIQVNDTGDISKFTLNKKVVPITEPKTLKDLSQKITKSFKRSAPAFKKSLARKLKRADELVKDNKKKTVVKSLGSQLKEANQRLALVEENISKAQKELKKHSDRQAVLSESVSKDNNTLQLEKGREQSLKAELAKLESEV